jgi:hypothetical protein
MKKIFLLALLAGMVLPAMAQSDYQMLEVMTLTPKNRQN